MLEEFLQEKNSEANAILMADERLSDADKQMAGKITISANQRKTLTSRANQNYPLLHAFFCNDLVKCERQCWQN